MGWKLFKVKDLIKRAKTLNKTIIFPEGTSDRVLRAVELISSKGLAKVILVGKPNTIMYKEYKIKNVTIMDPDDCPLTEELANVLYEKRKAKGMTLEQATQTIKDPFYFSTLMVECGYADGMLGGVETSTANCLRPGLQIIKGGDGIKTISSCVMFVGTSNLKLGENNVMFTADCALNISPTAEQLKDITLATAKTAKVLSSIKPKVALLSFSTKGSGGDDENVLKVQEAVKLLQAENVDFDIDGEMQLDAALVPDVAKLKAPQSILKGKANVLIFPDLQSGNIGYKLIERFTKLQAVGQIMQGFRKPINDMSRGCSVNDIIVMTAITAIQSNN